MTTPNKTPWLIPLEDRKQQALDAVQAGQQLVLMLYPSPDGSTFRYRGYNIYRVTEQSDRYQLIYFFLNEIDTVRELLPQASLLIYARLKQWSYQLDDLALTAHQYHIPVLNDLDDCVCGTKYIKDMFNTVAPDLIDCEYWINTCAQFELVSYATDGFIATNEYLGQILSDSHDQKPYYVIENSLNQAQIDYSATLQKSQNKNFTIGYFSGSATHAADLGVIYPELLQFLQDLPNAKLQIVGRMNLPASAQPFLTSGQIELHPLVDFLTLQELISNVDVNIAPLYENVFTNCKSELKFFESAIVDTPTIASPTYAFTHAIQHKKTGYLCRPGEWYDCLSNLYQHRDQAAKVAAAAHQHCLDHYSPQAMLPKVEAVYDQIIKDFSA